MKILVLSDLHIEFHRDHGRSFMDSLPTADDVDVCVLAGDITSGGAIPDTLEMFCDRFRHVVYVHGNHEFFGFTREQVVDFTRQAEERCSNLKWLHTRKDLKGSGAIEIEGQRFIGSTLWYRRPDMFELVRETQKRMVRSNYSLRSVIEFGLATESSICAKLMCDFEEIKGFRKWVYVENAETIQAFEGVQEGDVVITHHLPSEKSVHAKHKGSPMNVFFVCDVEAVIRRRRPAVWIHGHTHESMDYLLESTRVVCNPFGVINNLNKSFEVKIIEV